MTWSLCNTLDSVEANAPYRYPNGMQISIYRNRIDILMGCHDVRILPHVHVSGCPDVGMYAGQESERMTCRQSKFNSHPKIKRSPPYNFLLVKPSSQISARGDANTNTNTASSQISVRGGAVICLSFSLDHTSWVSSRRAEFKF